MYECPECGEIIDVGYEIKDYDIVMCPGCNSEFEYIEGDLREI